MRIKIWSVLLSCCKCLLMHCFKNKQEECQKSNAERQLVALKNAIKILERADEEYDKGNFIETMSLYQVGIQDLQEIDAFDDESTRMNINIIYKHYCDRAENTKNILNLKNSCENAFKMLKDGTDEIKKKNFVVALNFYQKGIQDLRTISHNTNDESMKNTLDEVCTQYEDVFHGNIKIAIQMVTRATEEDNKKNYVEALNLYQTGVQYFLESIKDGAYDESTTRIINEKCKQYEARAEKIKNFLETAQKFYNIKF